MFGYVMANEIENIDKVVSGVKKPFTAIMGGAKVSSKITIILKFEEVDNDYWRNDLLLSKPWVEMLVIH